MVRAHQESVTEKRNSVQHAKFFLTEYENQQTKYADDEVHRYYPVSNMATLLTCCSRGECQ